MENKIEMTLEQKMELLMKQNAQLMAMVNEQAAAAAKAKAEMSATQAELTAAKAAAAKVEVKPSSSSRDYMNTVEKLGELGVKKTEKVVYNLVHDEEVKENGKKAIKSLAGAAAIGFLQSQVGLGTLGDTVANVAKSFMVGNAIYKGAKAIEKAFDTDHISLEDIENFYM